MIPFDSKGINCVNLEVGQQGVEESLLQELQPWKL